MSWSETILATLKENDIRLVTYVPDNVLTPLIKGVAADNYFISVPATREDEAVGALTGAYMGGLRGVAMMQTSGFALIANALASLVVQPGARLWRSGLVPRSASLFGVMAVRHQV